MKNYYLITLLTISFVFVNAQTKEKDTTSSKVRGGIYIGIGAQVQNNLNINQKLVNSGLPTIPNILPEYTVGLEVFGEKYSGFIELSSLYSERNAGVNSTRFVTGTVRANFSWNLVNKKKTAFATGLNLSYSVNQFDIFNNNIVVDLNNLVPSANSGHISLNNRMLYLGPSAYVTLFKHSNWNIRLNVAYELALTRGCWRSDFVNIANTVNESGKNRFVFGIVF